MTDVANAYSPRLDLAVGPFATGESSFGAEYDALVRKHDAWLRNLHSQSEENCRRSDQPASATFGSVAKFNGNARCFLAIEIENATSRKHLMGGAINAAALGRFGVAVGWTEREVSRLARLRTYLHFLSSVGKNSFDTTNLLVLSADQLLA